MKLAKLNFDTRQIELIAAGGIGLAMVLLITVVTQLSHSSAPMTVDETDNSPISVFPDFASIVDVRVKKQQFFDFLEDYLDAENERVASLRELLLRRSAMVRQGTSLSTPERDWMMTLARTYRIEDLNGDSAILAELLLRVDVIPVSLALAQAANESAWGTSRFALEGNNIFGQWCYEEGCGLVPRRRASGATHEVKRFDSIQDSVESYFNNINSHHLYAYLRELRSYMRRQQLELDPMILAFGLARYSERGENYVDEVQNLIIQNDLQERDRQFPSIADVDPLH